MTHSKRMFIMMMGTQNECERGFFMNVNRQKLYLAMARACMDSSDLPAAAQLPRATVQNAITGRNIRPSTLGKIARALGVDPVEIIETEGKE